MPYDLEMLPDEGALAHAAAKHFVSMAEKAVAERGRFSVALAGGSTPRLTYALLAREEFSARIDWERTFVFWGDERCLPAEHPERNQRMAFDALLGHVPIPARHIFPIDCRHAPAAAAVAYARRLAAHFGVAYPGPAPRFDLILLGMGADGHTASLFPGSEALREGEGWVTAHDAEQLGSWRVTFTPTLINAARQATFLVAGAGKADTLRRVLEGAYQPEILPAQMVRPPDGGLLWLVDQAAAVRLTVD